MEALWMNLTRRQEEMNPDKKYIANIQFVK